MSHPDLTQIAAQLQSATVRERVLAMIELQKETVSAQAALPLLKQALLDDNVQIRGMAAFTLGIKRTPENLAILVQILATDADPNMRAMAAGALGYLEDGRSLSPLRRAFYEDESWLVQFSAAIALGNLKDSQAIAILLEALDRPEPLLQEAAIMALGEIGAVETVDRLLPFANAEDWMLRKRLAEALGNLPVLHSQTTLHRLRHDPNPQVSEAATIALEQLAKLL